MRPLPASAWPTFVGLHSFERTASVHGFQHVHLLVSLARDLSVAETVRLVKSNSSLWVHQTFPQRRAFAWQSGYAAFAVSYSNINSVKDYIAGQEEHHRVRTFQEELREFLQRHQIDWDERYVWD